jgi:hypothetical protein
MNGKWEVVEDGYNRRLHFVQSGTGLIIGHVEVSNYDSDNWYAGTDGPEGRKRLGDFVTEALAKRAVEVAQSPEASHGKYLFETQDRKKSDE